MNLFLIVLVILFILFLPIPIKFSIYYSSDDYYKQIVLADKLFDTDTLLANPRDVWVVPPAHNSGRGPCVAVYQRVIRF